MNGCSYRMHTAAAVSLRDRGAVHACHSLCLFTASLPLYIPLLLSVPVCDAFYGKEVNERKKGEEKNHDLGFHADS